MRFIGPRYARSLLIGSVIFLDNTSYKVVGIKYGISKLHDQKIVTFSIKHNQKYSYSPKRKKIICLVISKEQSFAKFGVRGTRGISEVVKLKTHRLSTPTQRARAFRRGPD